MRSCAVACCCTPPYQGLAPSAVSLLAEPDVASDLLSRRMVVFTWGAGNNLKDAVAKQKSMGIDAVRARAVSSWRATE